MMSLIPLMMSFEVIKIVIMRVLARLNNALLFRVDYMVSCMGDKVTVLLTRFSST